MTYLHSGGPFYVRFSEDIWPPRFPCFDKPPSFGRVVFTVDVFGIETYAVDGIVVPTNASFPCEKTKRREREGGERRRGDGERRRGGEEERRRGGGKEEKEGVKMSKK